MDDHYKLLGLHRNASKEDVKKAFRKLALQFHPDKHSGSPAYVKSNATHKFKQLSEAYEILSDDLKRSDYDIGHYSTRSSSTSTTSSSSSSNYSYNKNDYYHRSYYGDRYAGASSNWGKRADLGLRLEVFGRYLTSKSFQLGTSLAFFACVFIGGAYAIDATRDSIWKMKNTGKSFEEAMDSLDRAKAHKDKS